jgi:hypothetical protein
VKEMGKLKWLAQLKVIQSNPYTCTNYHMPAKQIELAGKEKEKKLR